jgi:hypothetical protein
MKGLTGTIKFDQHGLRTDFSLEVVELKKEGLAKVNKTRILWKLSSSQALKLGGLSQADTLFTRAST